MSEKMPPKLMKATLDLGQHTVLAALLVSFGVTASLTPSLVSFVEYWEPTAKVALVLGVGWALLTLSHFMFEIQAIAGKEHPGLSWILGLILGVTVVLGTMTVAVSWAANAVALRYCQNKPMAVDIDRCESAFSVPQSLGSTDAERRD